MVNIHLRLIKAFLAAKYTNYVSKFFVSFDHLHWAHLWFIIAHIAKSIKITYFSFLLLIENIIEKKMQNKDQHNFEVSIKIIHDI